ncbi:MAG: zinc ribbon domain-containing protein, partial [Lachnospiraceae bacterium]
MALIQCPECNQQISDSAKSCPNCGYSISERYKYVVQIQEYDTDTSALAGINSVFGINLSYNQCTHILNNLPYNFGDFSN